MKSLTSLERIEIEVLTARQITSRYDFPLGIRKPERAYRLFTRKANQTVGFVAIDDRSRGPGLGGVRLAPGVTLPEVCGLASAMTLKSAAALLPLGGAKSGLLGTPSNLTGAGKTELIARVAEALWQIPEYVPGPDMGTDEKDMQAVYDFFSMKSGKPQHGRGGIGRPPSMGGFPIDEWGLTAHGLFAAAREAERQIPGFQISGSRVIIQGFGNVGHAVAAKLAAAGAIIVGASDVTCGLYNAKGLDINELSAARRRPYGLAGYQGATDTHLVPEALDRLLEHPCDILVPAARPDIIRETNAGRITARLILQGANNPVRHSCEGQLHRRGIANLTDFIVNAGGVIAGAVELKADRDPEFSRKIRSDGASGRLFLEKLVTRVVAENVAEVFGRQKRAGSNILWKAAAMQLAKERLTSEKLRVLPELEP